VNTALIFLLAYTVGLTAFGVWIGRHVKVPADFFVAGRRLTWPLVGATVLAANVGAGTTVGTAGLAYHDGISALWWNGAAGLGTLILALWVGPKLWALATARGHFTVGDFLEDRYGGTVRCLGFPLARLEGQVALPAVLARWRSIEAAGEPRWIDSMVLRGMQAMPLRVRR
jgi:SSS family solute:Na+ symporter